MVKKSLDFLGLPDNEELAVVVICTVPPAPAEPTANFMAPIGIGLDSRRGAQVVLHDTPYQPREPFLERMNGGGGG
jgi:flagellar assembly factor FliW